jgi:probable F420-dependent oxidoreductase
MGTNRNFRFGVMGLDPSERNWRDTARKAEDLGYSTLLISDHMGHGPAPLIYAATALEATTHLRVGTLVLAAPFRNPAVLAKEIATLDLLSEGRFEPGLGAGWPMTSPTGIADQNQTGLAFGDAAVRLERLIDAFRILRLFLTSSEAFDYESEHITIKGLVPQPRRVTQTDIPIMVAGAGPRIMRFAAREADILNIAPRPPVRGTTSVGSIGFGLTMADEIALIKEAAGERYPNIELSVMSQSPLVETSASNGDSERLIASLAEGLKISSEDVRAMPGTLIGSASELTDRIQEHREEFDLSYRIVPLGAMEAFAPIVSKLAGQ